VPDTDEKTAVLDFLNQSTRGLIKGFRASNGKLN
jgi:hypothetical protein